VKDHYAILRKVGWVFIVVGLIDFGLMIYSIVNKASYNSSFNIFAVIAGIFLLKGNLKATRLISLFIAIFIGTSIGNIVFMPFLSPIDLLLTSFRLEPINHIISFVSFLTYMAISVWGYCELTSEPVRTAMDESGVNYISFFKKPIIGFGIGGCLTLYMVILMSSIMNGATATEVKQRAAVQVGKGYKFHIDSINWSSSSSNKHVYSIVTAYNDAQIKNIVVEWSE